MRRCACPCNQPLVGRSAAALYIDHRHAQRAYRARVKTKLEAAGLPTSLSLASVEVSSATNGNNGDAHAGRNGAQRRRSGLQVSYRKAVEQVAYIFRTYGYPEADAQRLARAMLLPALSQKQREVLAAPRAEREGS